MGLSLPHSLQCGVNMVFVRLNKTLLQLHPVDKAADKQQADLHNLIGMMHREI